jgi:hypothetical protein
MNPEHVTSDSFAAGGALAAPPGMPRSGAGGSAGASVPADKEPAALAIRGMRAEGKGHCEAGLGSARPEVYPGAMRVVSALDTSKQLKPQGGGSIHGSDDDGGWHEAIGLSDMAFYFEFNAPLCMVCPPNPDPATPCVRFAAIFSAPRLEFLTETTGEEISNAWSLKIKLLPLRLDARAPTFNTETTEQTTRVSQLLPILAASFCLTSRTRVRPQTMSSMPPSTTGLLQGHRRHSSHLGQIMQSRPLGRISRAGQNPHTHGPCQESLAVVAHLESSSSRDG